LALKREHWYERTWATRSTSRVSAEHVVNNPNAPGSRRVLIVWIWSDHRLGIRYSLIHDNRRELHAFDASPIPLEGARHFFASSHQRSLRGGMLTSGRNRIAVPTHDDKSCALHGYKSCGMCPHLRDDGACSCSPKTLHLHAIHGHG